MVFRCPLLPLAALALVSAPLPGQAIVAGGDRPVAVHTPPGYDPDVPSPLVLLLHGWGGSGAGMINLLGASVRNAGMMYAAPDGIPDRCGSPAWNATEGCCGCGGVRMADDSSYLRAVIDEVQSRLNVDPRRIYVIGYSAGGAMAFRLACDDGGRIAAIVSFAGPSWKDPALCQKTGAVHILEIIGTADDSYGPFEVEGVPIPGALETVLQWVTINGCSEIYESPEPLDLSPPLPGAETAVRRYVSSCSPLGSAEMWTVAGADHGFISQTGSMREAAVDWLLDHPKEARVRPAMAASAVAGRARLEITFSTADPFLPDGVSVTDAIWSFGADEAVRGNPVSHLYTWGGVHRVELRLETNAGVSDPAYERIAVSCPSEPPAPWVAVDIGEARVAGGAQVSLTDKDRIVLCAAGSALAGTQDGLFFVQQPVQGDQALSFRIQDLSTEARGSLVGCMLREDLDPGARFVGVLLRADGFAILYHRPTRSGSVRNAARLQVTLPADLKIERRGPEFTAFARSAVLADYQWAEIGRVGPDRFPAYQDFAPEYHAGIAATAAVAADLVFFEALSATVGSIELSPVLPAERFIRGDGNGDAVLDLSDALFLLNALFLGTQPPRCADVADANDDGTLDVSDAVAHLGFLFLGTAAPPPPFPDCGVDPAEDDLGCAISPAACR
jgi:polyhydroxybutyrate depolymerase